MERKKERNHVDTDSSPNRFHVSENSCHQVIQTRCVNVKKKLRISHKQFDDYSRHFFSAFLVIVILNSN
jgi:hypothetical protein